MREKKIFLDMDGTFVDFYSYPNWLDYLLKEETTPYEMAKPLVSMQELSNELNRLQSNGYKIYVISWGSKGATEKYLKQIEKAKKKWIKKNLKNFTFNEIFIVPYGTYKEKVANNSKGYLFDDELNNRKYWNGTARTEKNLIEKLRKIKQTFPEAFKALPPLVRLFV